MRFTLPLFRPLHTLILISFLFLPTPHLHLNYFNQTKHVVIFVHGTILPGLALLNPYKSYMHTLTAQDWYYRCMSAIRKDPLFQEDSLMLNEGLSKIDPTLLTHYLQQKLPSDLSKKGAYQTIGAYHLIQKTIDPTTPIDYYTFGFSGIFSDLYRKEAAYQLYQELSTLVQTYCAQGYTPSITLCGYSHGGNVLLYLADAENHKKSNLFIDTIVLLGTPIQPETAYHAFHPMFSTIINLYSQGDTIQGSDTYSTPSGRCYQTFSQLFSKDNIPYRFLKRIFDIRLLAHQSSTSFGHFTYWFLNQYNLPFFSTETSEVKAVRDALSPLPLVALTPAIIKLISTHSHTLPSTLDLSITAPDNTCSLTLFDTQTQQPLAHSPDLRSTLRTAQNYARSTWLPYAQATETTRITTGFLTALKTLNT
jgi:hypothetical protein